MGVGGMFEIFRLMVAGISDTEVAEYVARTKGGSLSGYGAKLYGGGFRDWLGERQFNEYKFELAWERFITAMVVGAVGAVSMVFQTRRTGAL